MAAKGLKVQEQLTAQIRSVSTQKWKECKLLLCILCFYRYRFPAFPLPLFSHSWIFAAGNYRKRTCFPTAILILGTSIWYFELKL